MIQGISRVLSEFLQVLGEMSPYLLFGFLVAGVLSVVIRPSWVERHLGGRGFWPVFKASLFGVPLPLCSCGVIPVAASLRKHGASREATTAFLLSTPQTGVDSILVTLSLLGITFAVYRPLAALATGLIGGWVVMAFGSRKNAVEEPLPECADSCCADGAKRGKPARALEHGFVTLPEDIAKPLLVGLLVAALLSAIVPEDFFAGYLGGGIGAFSTMIAMMLLGIPVYVCATASVPVALALMKAGLSPGAALVFLMTGPATNAAGIATVAKIMGKRVAACYLATVAATSLGAGLLLNSIYTGQGGWRGERAPFMMPTGVKVVSAMLLLAVLGNALFKHARKTRAHDAKEGETGQKSVLKIDGMTCNHCAEAVTKALLACPGVRGARVVLKEGLATIWGEGFDVNALSKAVEGAGYSLCRGGHQCEIHNQ